MTGSYSCMVPSGTGSQGKVDAPQQVREPRVGAQAVESLLHFEVNQPVGAFVISLLQPGERPILLAQAGIDGGDLVGRDIPPLSELLQLGNALLRFSSLPRYRIGMGEFRFRKRTA